MSTTAPIPGMNLSIYTEEQLAWLFRAVTKERLVRAIGDHPRANEAAPLVAFLNDAPAPLSSVEAKTICNGIERERVARRRSLLRVVK